MKEPPPDGKYTRKGERDGPALTPGERAINWAKALAIIIPLLGIGAIADEPVKRFFAGSVENADDVKGIVEGGFEEQVKHSISSIIDKLEKLEKQIARMESRSNKGDSQLSDRVENIEKLVN